MPADPIPLESIFADQDRAEEIQADAREGLETLRAQIIVGEATTGDTMQDGLIAVYGNALNGRAEREQIYQNFKLLNEALAANVGQPFLLVHRHAVPVIKSRLEGPHRVSTTLYYGTVSADGVVFDTQATPWPRAQLPTNLYARFMDNGSQKDSHAKPLTIAGAPDDWSEIAELIDIGKQWGLTIAGQPREIASRLEVIFGLDGVEEWFDMFGHSGYYAQVRGAAVQLGLPIPEPVGMASEKWDQFCIEMSDDYERAKAAADDAKEKANAALHHLDEIADRAKRFGVELDLESQK